MRIIEGLNWNARVEVVYNKYQILTVSKMYKYEVGKMMYLFNANRLSESFLDYFSYVTSSSTYSTILVVHQPMQFTCLSFLPIDCNILLNFKELNLECYSQSNKKNAFFKI